jgi:hypothetical protein
MHQLPNEVVSSTILQKRCPIPMTAEWRSAMSLRGRDVPVISEDGSPRGAPALNRFAVMHTFRSGGFSESIQTSRVN